MKHKLTDALQVIAAVLLTGGMLASAAPLPQASTPVEHKEEVVETGIKKPVVAAVEPVPAVLEPKAVTWQDNPQKCDQTLQYIAEAAPFNCIDKPKAATAPKVAPAASFGGSCAEWIAAAGISDVASANELIRRESGCDPNVVNRSSGACGVAQELPCGKSGCSLGDGACQVRWMNSYVLQRYKSWANAVAFHDRNNWY